MTVVSIADVTGPYAPPVPAPNPLQETVNGLNLRIDRLQTEVRNHQIAWDRVGEFITDKAEEHSLCSVYDSVVEEWNQGNPSYQLPLRKKEIDLEIRVNFTGTVRPDVDCYDLRAFVEDMLDITTADDQFDGDLSINVRAY